MGKRPRRSARSLEPRSRDAQWSPDVGGTVEDIDRTYERLRDATGGRAFRRADANRTNGRYAAVGVRPCKCPDLEQGHLASCSAVNVPAVTISRGQWLAQRAGVQKAYAPAKSRGARVNAVQMGAQAAGLSPRKFARILRLMGMTPDTGLPAQVVRGLPKNVDKST